MTKILKKFSFYIFYNKLLIIKAKYDVIEPYYMDELTPESFRNVLNSYITLYNNYYFQSKFPSDILSSFNRLLLYIQEQ